MSEIFPFVFAVFAIAVTLLLINQLGQYGKLAEIYGCSGQFAGKTWAFQSVSVGQLRYRNCVTVGGNRQGLYLSPMAWTRIGSPPLFIPWQALALEERQLLGITYYVLRPQALPEAKIQLSVSLLHRLQTVSEGCFPR